MRNSGVGIVFETTGRRCDVHEMILGLSLEGREFAFQGGVASLPYEGQLTPAERRELAEFMKDLWEQFGSAPA